MRELTVLQVRSVPQQPKPETKSRRSPQRVLDSVLGLLLERYHITMEQLTSDSKKGHLVYVRQLFCY